MRPFLTYLAVICLMILTVNSVPLWSAGNSGDNSVLEASSMKLMEIEDGYQMELDGPVRILFNGDEILADYALATLNNDLSSLTDAVEYIELSGNVSFTGRDDTMGWAETAVYNATGEKITLEGSPRFSKEDLEISAGVVEYTIPSTSLTLSAGVELTTGSYHASCNTCNYKINSESGSMSGNVEIRYRFGNTLVGDEIIDEIIFKSGALFLSKKDGRISTPDGSGGTRTSIDAGNLRLESDRMVFTVRDEKVVGITAEGDVVGTGDGLRLESDKISVSQGENPEAYLINASSAEPGGVKFLVYDQDGTADSVEVNFNRGWSIRLVGGSIGGELSEQQVGDIVSGNSAH